MALGTLGFLPHLLPSAMVMCPGTLEMSQASTRCSRSHGFREIAPFIAISALGTSSSMSRLGQRGCPQLSSRGTCAH